MQRGLLHNIYIYLLVLVSGVGIGCTMQTTEITPYPIQRFDSELYGVLNDTASYAQFAACYGNWLPLYSSGVLSLPQPADGDYLPLLQQVYSDSLFVQLAKDVQQQYPTLDSVNIALAHAFARYERALPSAVLPTIYTHLSGLHQSVVVADTLLSISLDHYLGNDYPIYKSLLYPYQRIAKEQRNIAPDVLRAWIYTQYPQPSGSATLLDKIVYEGTVLYALTQLFPSWSVYDLLAYTPEQAAWCRQNESQIWQRVVTERHLYATSKLLLAQYTAPAPFTAPVSVESPPLLGTWLGWRMVSNYLDNQRGASWQQLLQQTPLAQEVLRISKYRGK